MTGRPRARSHALLVLALVPVGSYVPLAPRARAARPGRPRRTEQLRCSALERLPLLNVDAPEELPLCSDEVAGIAHSMAPVKSSRRRRLPPRDERSVAWYLRTIGDHDLLDSEEELELARRCRRFRR